MSQFRHGGHAQVAQAPLGAADLDGMHVAALGERFLSDADAVAFGADVVADDGLGLHLGQSSAIKPIASRTDSVLIRMSGIEASSKKWHQRALWRIAIVLVILGLFGAWRGGSFDHVLVNVGLNAKACARNGFGATFCGEELAQYREHQQQAKEKGEAIEHNAQETSDRLQQEAKEGRQRSEERIKRGEEESQRIIESLR